MFESMGKLSPRPWGTNTSEASSLDESASLPSQRLTSQADPEPAREGRGCCGKCIRVFWATRETEDTEQNPELYIQTTLRELIIYLIFLTVTCIITFGMTSTTMFYYTSAMSSLFLNTKSDFMGTFRTMTNTLDFWRFAQGPLLDGIHWDKWYNGAKVPEDQKGYIYYENKLLGLPRLRQLKVHSNSCIVHKDFRTLIPRCYAPYKRDLEDKRPYGAYDDGNNYTAWFYRTEQELDGSGHWGYIATYSGAGYVQNLGTTKDESKRIIDYLFQQKWITRGTRAVFIDFTVYNANINLFCVVRLLTEFPATGGVVPSWMFRTVKLIPYVSKGDYFIFSCEIMFCVFIGYYIIEEMLEIKKHKCNYLNSFWNCLDIVIIIISLLCIAFHVFRSYIVKEKLIKLIHHQDIYPDFESLGYWETRFVNAVAIAVFLAWIKVFKYIGFNKTMTQLSSTLSRCAKDLAGFAIMFFIVFVAFTQLGYLLFGTMVKDFSTFQNAFFTLFRIILGDFDFAQLEAANRVLGPIYFMLYVFFVFFVLINMFLAIINDTYTEVKVDMSQQEDEFRMTDYFKEKANNFLAMLHLTSEKIDSLQKKLPTDKLLGYEEWKQHLKSCGYADEDIQAMFAKYDYDGNRVLDNEERKRMQKDLEKQKKSLKKDSKGGLSVTKKRSDISAISSESDEAIIRKGGGGGVTYDDLVVLSRRVDRIENTILCQLEAVLAKLGTIEASRVTKRFDSPRYSITQKEGPSSGRKK